MDPLGLSKYVFAQVLLVSGLGRCAPAVKQTPHLAASINLGSISWVSLQKGPYHFGVCSRAPDFWKLPHDRSAS